MRALLSFAVVAVVMALFHHLTAASPVEARATLALGFLIVVAHLGADAAARWRLPRLTGALLLGFAVGPGWTGLVRGDEVAALDVVTNAALALVAFAAGAAVSSRAFRTGLGPLLRRAGRTLSLPVAAVTFVMLTTAPWFPLTRHQPFGDALAVALVLGTLAAACSPLLTIAVLDETGALGPAGGGTLDVTVLAEFAVVAVFALVLLVARPLVSPGSLDLVSAARGIGALAISGLVGAAAALALSKGPGASWSAPWTLVALAFVGTAVARLLRVDPVLMLLVAGVLVGQYAPAAAERLRHPMQQSGPVVYTVLFALLGAGLRTAGLAELWPWIVLLVGLRITGLRYGALWAARAEGGRTAGAGWRGLVSQAGVVVGLAHVARRAFPEWGVSLEMLVVTMIGVHEVVGPVLMRRALARAGELPEEMHAAASVGSAGVGIAADRGV